MYQGRESFLSTQSEFVSNLQTVDSHVVEFPSWDILGDVQTEVMMLGVLAESGNSHSSHAVHYGIGSTVTDRQYMLRCLFHSNWQTDSWNTMEGWKWKCQGTFRQDKDAIKIIMLHESMGSKSPYCCVLRSLPHNVQFLKYKAGRSEKYSASPLIDIGCECRVGDSELVTHNEKADWVPGLTLDMKL